MSPPCPRHYPVFVPTPPLSPPCPCPRQQLPPLSPRVSPHGGGTRPGAARERHLPPTHKCSDTRVPRVVSHIPLIPLLEAAGGTQDGDSRVTLGVPCPQMPHLLPSCGIWGRPLANVPFLGSAGGDQGWGPPDRVTPWSRGQEGRAGRKRVEHVGRGQQRQ